MDPETTLALIGLRKEMPQATVKGLIRTAQQRGVLDAEKFLAESTLWRLLKREGLMERSEKTAVDRRRFGIETPVAAEQTALGSEIVGFFQTLPRGDP